VPSEWTEATNASIDTTIFVKCPAVIEKEN